VRGLLFVGYLVGLEDKSLGERLDDTKFTMEESLTELSEYKIIKKNYNRNNPPDQQCLIMQAGWRSGVGSCWVIWPAANIIPQLTVLQFNLSTAGPP